MEKDRFLPAPSETPARLSLAEEQRLAFEKDRQRERRPILSLNWSGQIFRN
jgi:hypothetical protein